MRNGILFACIAVVASAVTTLPAKAQSIFTDTRVLNNNAWTDLGDDIHPSIATDGNGKWIAVWTSRDSLSDTIGGDEDILFSISTDDALIWSVPAALHSSFSSDSARDEHPTIATDRAGNWIVVWDRIDPNGGEYGADHDVFSIKSSDGGLSWGEPAPLNPNATSDSGGEWGPSIIMDGSSWIVLWNGGIGADADLFVVSSADAGTTWSLPSPVNPNAGGDRVYDWEADLASDGKGVWVATWRITSCCEPQRIVASRSIDNGLTWSAPTVLLWGWGFHTQVETDGKGNWIAAWSSSGSSGFQEIFYSRSTDGLSWSPVAALSTSEGGDHHVSLATDRAGNWVAVWEYGHYAIREIRTSISTDDGASWSPSEPLNGYTAAHTRLFSYPRVVPDGRGDWVALWTSNNSFGNSIGGDQDILFVTGWATANTPPVAIAGPDRNMVLNEPAVLSALDSYDPDGSIVSYLWDFGDGSSSDQGVVTHTYAIAGEVSATLTVTDDQGAEASDTVDIFVQQRPLPDAGEDIRVMVHASILLDGSGSSDPDGEITSYHWDFGDGQTSEGALQYYTWRTSGQYAVTLTVTDDQELSADDAVSVYVTTPAEGVSDLITKANNAGIEKTKQLEEAQKLIEFGNIQAALDKIGSFRNKVERLFARGKITRSDWEALMNQMDDIVHALAFYNG